MPTIRKKVALSEDHVNDFEKHHPGASLSWILDMLLGKYVSQYKHTPEEYAEIAAVELKEEIAE